MGRGLVLCLLLTLGGCRSLDPATSKPAVAAAGKTVRGGVHGGSQPVAGAHIYLLAAGTGSIGGASVSLLDATSTGASDGHGAYVVSDANGAFTITGDYQCPQADAMVYVLAVGGNPGLGPGQENPDLALMTGMGSCQAMLANAATINIGVTEVTTAVTVNQISRYMSGAFRVSSDNSAAELQGIAAAFASIPQMVDISSGTARTSTTDGSATVPASTINTVADILASCVNSAGSASSSNGPCSQLEQGTTSNTVDAMLNIATNPSQNVSSLFNLVPVAAPYQPTLPSSPTDFTLRLSDPVLPTNCSPTCFSVQVNAGGPAVGTYAADVGFSGGFLASNPASVALDGVSDPAPMEVYQTERYGDCSYSFSNFVPGSAHLVRLHFSENYWTSTGQRIFSVSVNGTPVLRNFDIVAQAGGAFRALVQTFIVTADDQGAISVLLGPTVLDQPKVDAIEID